MANGILGIGVCTLDVLTHTSTFPLQGDVEEANQALVMGGGPVATALAAASSLGSKTTMLDRLGDDWRSRLILEQLQSLGVGCQEIKIEPGAEASLASVLVRTSDGARAVRFIRSTARAITAQEIQPELVTSHRFVHCNGRHLAGCLHAAELCLNTGGRTQVSFDGGANRYRDELIPLMAVTDIAIVALEFALAASGETSPDPAARRLMELCPRAHLIGITDGKRGSWIYPRTAGHFHQPAFTVAQAVDTTGCGDVYHGTFLHALDTGCDLNQAAQLASAAGALNASALGGRGNLPTQDAITRILNTA